ncbi:MAG: hypothetical protein IT318_18835 [Anaerolineales bacterium]|nr:hypothetical protein [Anaerolineales bacterium]
MDIVLMLHSLVRWLVLLAAVAAIVKFALGWLRGSEWSGLDRGLSTAFSGLMSLQILLGLIVLFGEGFFGDAGFPLQRIEHALIMTLAVALSHLPSLWKNAAPAIRFRNALLCVLIALVLILAGIAVVAGSQNQ